MHAPRDTHAAPVLGLYATPTAQAHYRLAVPLRAAFGAEGCAVTAYADATQAQRDAARVVVLSKLTVRDDLPLEAAAGLVAQIRDGGRRRVLVDIDDDLTPPAGFRAESWTEAAAARLAATARAADALVCTNPTLAGRLRRLHRDVRVAPNYVDAAAWPTPAPSPAEPPVVVLAGSVSHIADWRVVEAPLRALRGAYRLRVCGHLPAYLQDLCDEHRPWTRDIGAYPAMLAGAHIGLCPLPDSAFNRCKSPVKLYEYALAGLAVLGSETQYGPALRAAGLGHAVAHTPAQWERALRVYLTRPDRRSADAAALGGHVARALDARRHADALRAAYA